MEKDAQKAKKYRIKKWGENWLGNNFLFFFESKTCSVSKGKPEEQTLRKR